MQQQKEVFEAEEKVAAEEEARAEQIVAETQGLVDEYESSYQQLSAEAAALLEAERKAAEEAERRRAEQERERERQNHRDGDNYPQTVGGTAVTRAYGEIGKPYVWGACGPGSFDCSGLVSFCLSGVYGKRLGTASSFTKWPRVGNPQPGDICCNSHHCGIYIGNNQIDPCAAGGRERQDRARPVRHDIHEVLARHVRNLRLHRSRGGIAFRPRVYVRRHGPSRA